MDNLVQQRRARCSDDHVVDVEEEVGDVGSSAKNEKGGVGSSRLEAETNDVCREPSEPCPWRLAKTIQGFVEATDGLRTLSIHEANGLLAQHKFIEMSVEKSI